MFLKTYKIDKKILIILIIILIVFSLAGYFIYKYIKEIRKIEQNYVGGTATEEFEQNNKNGSPASEDNSPVEIKLPQIEAELQPGLSICADKCGDSVCQVPDLECKDKMNCDCPEDKNNCPSDCQ